MVQIFQYYFYLIFQINIHVYNQAETCYSKKGTNSNNSPLHLPAWMLKVNKL